MTKEELKRKQYDTWNKYYQKHKSEINARRKKVREGYKNKLSVAEKRIAELEKENTELKKQVENLQKYLDSRNCYRECAETWLKLTEAKKLLKQFLEAKNGEDTYKAEWEAEQFLKD